MSFRWFLGARIISVVGGGVTVTAMPILAYALSGSALWSSLVVSAAGVPYLVFGLAAGVVADRCDRLVMIAVCEAVAALTVLVVPVAYLTGHLHPLLVVLAVVGVRSAFVFYDAALLGVVPTLVGGHALPRAQSLLFGAGFTVELGVPALTAMAITWAGAPALVAVGSAVSLCAVTPVLRCRRALASPTPVRGAGRGFGAQVRQGLVWLVGHGRVRYHSAMAVVHALSQGCLAAAVLPWADTLVTDPAPLQGVMFSASAGGALVGALVCASLIRRFGETSLMFWLSWAVPVVFVVAAFAGTVLVALGVMVVAGGCTVVAMISSTVYRQRATPTDLLSRVNVAGKMVATGVAYPCGALLCGVLAGRVGVPVTFLVCGSVVLVLLVLVAWTHRRDLVTNRSPDPR